MYKILIAITAVTIIGVVEIFAIVYQVDGGGLAAAIGAIAAIATWRAIKSTETPKPPPEK